MQNLLYMWRKSTISHYPERVKLMGKDGDRAVEERNARGCTSFETRTEYQEDHNYQYTARAMMEWIRTKHSHVTE